jgi:Na+-transporting NADH:ubiquinone oxidoreductase subunit NqrD
MYFCSLVPGLNHGVLSSNYGYALNEISVICVINGTGHLYGYATNTTVETVTFKSTNKLIINVTSNFEEEVSQNLL